MIFDNRCPKCKDRDNFMIIDTEVTHGYDESILITEKCLCDSCDYRWSFNSYYSLTKTDVDIY